MLQLIYQSIATSATPDLELPALRAQSARNNARDEITGVLLARHGHFLQILEGPKEAVENTFLRMIVDDRHHSLLLLSRKIRAAREFGDWSMGMCDGPAEEEDILERVREKLGEAPDHLQDAFEAVFPGDACKPVPAAVTRSDRAPPA